MSTPTGHPPPSDRVALRVPSDPRYLPLLRTFVGECAALAGFTEADRDRLALAVTEAASNVIRHVYKGRTDQPIELELLPRRGELRLEMTDFGRFVDPARIASRPLDEVRPGGLGVHLIRSTMDVVEYNQNRHGGTTLTLVKYASAGKDPA